MRLTARVYSLTGREVTTSTVAALLTILGYSLYDCVIVFDRVRENAPRMPRAAFSQIVNRSMSDVLTRSLATSFSTLLGVSAIFLFGGETLKDFAFALLVGILSGTYSSIFIAAPVLTEWKERVAGERLSDLHTCACGHARRTGHVVSRRTPDHGQLRWFITTDRGLYLPGETIHLKGWLRHVPPGPRLELRLPENVAAADYRLNGPRGEELVHRGARSAFRRASMSELRTRGALLEALQTRARRLARRLARTSATTSTRSATS